MVRQPNAIPGLQKGEVPVQVLDLAVAAGVGTVDDLDDVALLDGVLLRVQRHREAVLATLLQRLRLALDHLALEADVANSHTDLSHDI